MVLLSFLSLYYYYCYYFLVLRRISIFDQVDILWCVQVFDRERIPADLLLLATAEDDGGRDSCHVQTMELDGETNLKLRQALPITADTLRMPADFAHFEGVVQCETPNKLVNNFVGTVSGVAWRGR
jgi:magnesium-transporting ATPase (P-type)